MPDLRVQLATVIAVVMEIDDCADTAERVDAAKLALDALLGEVATWLRSDKAHTIAASKEMCECRHDKRLHPYSGCINGITFTRSSSCPCAAYQPMVMVDDPFLYHRNALHRLADSLEGR